MECKYSIWLYQLVALHAGRREVSKLWHLQTYVITSAQRLQVCDGGLIFIAVF
jgi:hypothetical protein